MIRQLRKGFRSSNLSNDIKEALENSRYLIVICSETTKDSRWCMEEERDILRRLEHRRWNAYTRFEGYVKGPKNHIAKTHPTLVTFDELSPENQKKDDI